MSASESRTSIQTDDHSHHSTGLKLLLPALVLAILLLLAVTAAAVVPHFNDILALLRNEPSIVVAIGVSIILAATPMFIIYVQTTARDRQILKLQSITERPTAKTTYYNSAMTYLTEIRPAQFNKDYTAPVVCFSLIVLIFSAMAFIGPFADGFFKHKSFLLGGLRVLPLSGDDVITYQKGTFICGVMAFIGCYVYMLGRILDRVNNNDIYPISFYYYAARFIIACFVAAVLRHVIGMFGIDNDAIVVLAGFVVGLAPDLFITQMARRGFQLIKVPGIQRDPPTGAIPTNMNLLMIEGLSRDKIDRLNELGIDNAQVLANQNPYIIWPKVPYDLGLIIDWIAQAQLYAKVKEKGLTNLRAKCINDIFDLYNALNDQSNLHESICVALNLPPTCAHSLLNQLSTDQGFRRLLEVRDALLPH